MFFATGLEPTQHEITITNLVGGRQLVLDYALVTKMAKKSSGLVQIIFTTGWLISDQTLR